MIRTDRIVKAERFLQDTFQQSKWFKEHPVDANYRLEHSFRTANIAMKIAEGEGINAEALYIGGLLHDIAYCEVWNDFEKGWIEHGRTSARIARPFLMTLEMEESFLQEICYGIAIHVDGKADFEGERTSFALSIGCADNIDRSDVYRIYEGMQYAKFSQQSLSEKMNWISKKENTIKSELQNLTQRPINKTADEMLRDKLMFQADFYAKLEQQLLGSTAL